MALRVELVLESDFADIFEVKEGRATGQPLRAARNRRASIRVDARHVERSDWWSRRPAPPSGATAWSST